MLQLTNKAAGIFEYFSQALKSKAKHEHTLSNLHELQVISGKI